MYILPYKAGSQSARALRDVLSAPRISLDRNLPPWPASSNTAIRKVINWGNTGRNLQRQLDMTRIHMYNTFDAVSTAANKLHAFQAMESAGVSIVPFTTDIIEAQQWLGEGRAVVERQTLTGHSGAGINIVLSDNVGASLNPAPLYTQYTPRSEEYRVHVINGQVVDVQRKARRPDVAINDVNWHIRNYDNGFIYVRGGVDQHTIDNQVLQQAVDAVRAIGLDFGAVDVIWNGTRNRAYVLEVNTACGLEGTTLERYAQAFRELSTVGSVTTTWMHYLQASQDEPVEVLASQEEDWGFGEENIEPSEESVVQSNTSSSVFGIFCNQMIDREVGVFNSEEDARNAITSSQYYNMSRVDSSIRLEVLPLGVR